MQSRVDPFFVPRGINLEKSIAGIPIVPSPTALRSGLRLSVWIAAQVKNARAELSLALLRWHRVIPFRQRGDAHTPELRYQGIREGTSLDQRYQCRGNRIAT